MSPQQLKALRESIGTQEFISPLVGFSVRTIAKWESEGGAGPAVETYLRMLHALKNSRSGPEERRIRALMFGSSADADPLADYAGEFDQRVENLRALRAGRAAQTIPPPRATMDRRPEKPLKTAAETNDPLANVDYDRAVRVARKRGPASPADDVVDDIHDPLDGRSYDEGVRAARAKRQRGDE